MSLFVLRLGTILLLYCAFYVPATLEAQPPVVNKRSPASPNLTTSCASTIVLRQIFFVANFLTKIGCVPNCNANSVMETAAIDGTPAAAAIVEERTTRDCSFLLHVGGILTIVEDDALGFSTW